MLSIACIVGIQLLGKHGCKVLVNMCLLLLTKNTHQYVCVELKQWSHLHYIRKSLKFCFKSWYQMSFAVYGWQDNELLSSLTTSALNVFVVIQRSQIMAIHSVRRVLYLYPLVGLIYSFHFFSFFRSSGKCH